MVIPTYWNQGRDCEKKGEYSGNLMANGLFQLQKADQRQCHNISFPDKEEMLTV